MEEKKEKKTGHFLHALKTSHLRPAVALLLCICLIIIGIAAWHAAERDKEKRRADRLSAEVEQLAAAKTELEAEIDDLNDKVAVMSKGINNMLRREKEAKAEEEGQKVPGGLPLSGKAVIVQSSETDTGTQEEAAEEDAGNDNGDEVGIQELLRHGAKEQMVIFSAQPGVKVIATANGKVSAVDPDRYFGFGVTIEHENGYETIYRTPSEPKVSVNDEVHKGDVLFDVQLENQMVGYQIKQEGNLTDPMELMDIAG